MKAISVRLDDDIQRALRILEATGLSRSAVGQLAADNMWAVDEALVTVLGLD